MTSNIFIDIILILYTNSLKTINMIDIPDIPYDTSMIQSYNSITPLTEKHLNAKWKTKDNGTINVIDMDNYHLLNTINLLNKNNDWETEDLYDIMYDIAKQRGLVIPIKNSFNGNLPF